MAKITIAGDAVVIKSNLKLEDIAAVSKYRPNELVLKGGEDGKEPIFALCVTTSAGSINSVGASFSRADADGKAMLTMFMQGVPVEKAREWVADTLGSAIIHLNTLEARLPAVLEDIAAERAAVMENIAVAD